MQKANALGFIVEPFVFRRQWFDSLIIPASFSPIAINFASGEMAALWIIRSRPRRAAPQRGLWHSRRDVDDGGSQRRVDAAVDLYVRAFFGKFNSVIDCCATAVDGKSSWPAVRQSVRAHLNHSRFEESAQDG